MTARVWSGWGWQVPCDGTLEGLKGLGLMAMTVDHVNTFLLASSWPVGFAFGRLALPIFVIVLGINLARPGGQTARYRRILSRLAVAGLLATPFHVALGGAIRGAWPLNILFTLALITVVVWGLQGSRLQQAGAWVLLLVGGVLVETTTAGAQHAHLDGCPACAARLSELQALRTRICQQATYYPVPPSLENRIRIALDIPLAQPLPAVTPWHRPARWVGLGLGGAVAGAVALVMSLVPHLIPPSDADRLAEELVADHVRSLMADHLTDIASSDQHTVKPWFNGRLDFSPPVHDLTLDGFPLVGGRLDYLHGRTVAALVYRRRGHLINVFIWPASGAARTVPELTIRQGYHLLQWSQAGMAFQTISDLNLEELAQFVQHLRQ